MGPQKRKGLSHSFVRLMLGAALSAIFAFMILAPAHAAKPATNLSVKITSPASGQKITTGSTFTVATSSNVVRVDYSLIVRGLDTGTEFYLGSSTTRPFSFTWNSYAGALYGGADLLARASDSAGNIVKDETSPVVTGTLNGPLPQAKNAVDRFPGTQTTTRVGAAVNAEGRLQFNGEAGSYATWTIEAPVDGDYQIVFRSAQRKAASTAVSVDGTIVNPSVPFQAIPPTVPLFDTAQFNTTVAISSTHAKLHKGNNLIRLTTFNVGTPTIESLSISQPAS